MDEWSREALLQVVPQARFTRRSALQALAAGGALTGFAAIAGAGRDRLAVASQIEATPPEVPIPTQTQAFGPTIASKAAELGYDADRIYRFVADEVRYEAYAGALRGANGTLWGLAGNSVDKSILLAALLDESQILCRFASGELTEPAKAQLLVALSADVATIQSTYNAAAIAGYTPTGGMLTATPVTTPEATSGLTPDETQTWKALVDKSSHIQKLAAQRIASSRKVLSESLRNAGVNLPTHPELALPESEVAQHMWIQVADGPVWKDLDPTFAGGQRGDVLGSVAITPDQVPDDAFHSVTIKIIAEEITGGIPVRRDTTAFVAKSADLVARTITVSVTVPSAMAGIGSALNQAFTGKATFVPYIAVSGMLVAAAQTPIVFGSDGQSLLGALDNGTPAIGPAEGETVGLWYSVEVTSPGSEQVVIEREMIDRIGFVERSQPTIDLTKIAPVTLSQDEAGNSIVLELATATLLSIDVSDLPGTYAAQNELASDPFGGFTGLSATCAGLQANLWRQHLLAAGWHAYLDVPNITAFTLSSFDATKKDSQILISGDLVWRHAASIALGQSKSEPDVLPPLVVTGILNQVAESVLLDPSTWGSGTANQLRGGVTVQDVFDRASTLGVPIRVLRDASDKMPKGSSAEAILRIGNAIKSGQIVVIPDQPVKIGDRETIGWWLIDPQTGRATDMMENGRGFASTTIPDASVMRWQIAEDVEITKEVTSWMPWWRRVGGCVGAVALLAAAAIDPTSINGGTFSTAEGFAKLALRFYQRNPGFAKEVGGCL